MKFVLFNNCLRLLNHVTDDTPGTVIILNDVLDLLLLEIINQDLLAELPRKIFILLRHDSVLNAWRTILRVVVHDVLETGDEAVDTTEVIGHVHEALMTATDGSIVDLIVALNNKFVDGETG